MRYPSWTFDNVRGNAAFYAGPNSVYLYDPAQNQWTLVKVPGGPVLPPTTNDTSWAYDDISDTFVYVTGSGPSGFETWELPGSAISH
jgi:hypothetical protein